MISKDDTSRQTSKKIFIFLSAVIIIYAIMLTSVVPTTYNIKEGDIAKSDIKAQRDVEDKEATIQRQKEAMDSIGQQYDKRTDVETDAQQSVSSDFSKINSIKSQNIDINQKKSQLRNSPLQYDLSDAELNTWFSMNSDDFNNLQTYVLKVIDGMYSNGIKEDSNEDIKKAQNYIALQFSKSKLSKDTNNLGIVIAQNYIKPNLFVNTDKTNEVKLNAKKNVSPVIIKKDQIIVKEGEPVTKEQINILDSLGLLNDNKFSNWYIYVSLFALDFIIMIIEMYYLYKYHNKVFNNNRYLILIFLINIIYLIFARTLNIISPFLIPLGFLPMILTILLNENISIFISLFNCVLLSVIVGFNLQIVLIAVMSTLISAIVLKKIQMRNDILYASFYIGIVNSVITFSTGFLISNNFISVVEITFYAFLGACLSSILTIGFLPSMESIFDIVTTVKLLELSNPNQPLLKKLLTEAPGTYHHSIMVANLSEVAAQNIGCNPIFARAAAYYHDIGKIKRPYFFKENQFGMENPHDKMTPNLSAMVIISHVKDGIELAKEYNVPSDIQDIIAEHHGTTLTKYFYITMKNQSKKPEDVNEDEFRYPGPKPRSKESAIIMLADGVEASVRSIPNPTKGRIEEMVNNIIKSRLDEGELQNCDLTFNDLTVIRKTFLNTLNGVYHKRIEYPKDKSQLKNEKVK
ncbi:MAG: HD family phosphohydrolase [Clostridium sp.]|nr:HD family phosphohydrolase [Clostridium sp.]